MIKHIPVFIVVTILWTFSFSMAQEKEMIITPDMQFSYADTLYHNKEYQTAIYEFKRFIHFFPGDQRINPARFKTGMGLYHLQRYHEAARIFNEIIIQDKQNHISVQSVFMQSQAFEKMNNYGYAQIVLQNYLKITDDQQVKDKIYYHLARIDIELLKLQQKKSLNEAKHYLSRISPDTFLQPDKDRLNDLIFDLEAVKHKDPTTAGMLSIIPGGGYLYTQRYKDAFASFCLNTGLMIAAYTAFENENPALGSIIGLVEAGFYTGNIYGSISSAHKYNKNQVLKLFDSHVSIQPQFDLHKKKVQISLNYAF